LPEDPYPNPYRRIEVAEAAGELGWPAALEGGRGPQALLLWFRRVHCLGCLGLPLLQTVGYMVVSSLQAFVSSENQRETKSAACLTLKKRQR